jgi:hypothetical protein
LQYSGTYQGYEEESTSLRGAEGIGSPLGTSGLRNRTRMSSSQTDCRLGSRAVKQLARIVNQLVIFMWVVNRPLSSRNTSTKTALRNSS